MRPVVLSLQYPAADADSVVASVTPLAGGALTLVTATGVSFGSPTLITVTSVGNETGRTFTITGIDESGQNPLTVTLAGANAGVATTTRAFSSVTAVSVDAATAGAITVGSAQAGHSQTIPLNIYAESEVSIQVTLAGGTGTYTVQQTLDDPFSSTYPTWFDHPDTDLVASSANRQGNYGYVPRAMRLRVTAAQAATVTTLTVVQPGLA